MEIEDIYRGLGVEPDEEDLNQEEPTEDPQEPGEAAHQDQEAPAEEPGEEPEGGDGAEPDALEELRQSHEREMEDLRQQNRQALDAQVAAMGLTNPYDGDKPITTAAEYEAYQQQAREAQWQRIREQTGLTQQQLDELVAGLPQVREAQQAKADAEAAQRAADDRVMQQRLTDEIAAIHKLCPEVRDKDTLTKHESWPAVAKRMRETGCGVLDAFRLENFDTLTAAKAENVRKQVARNQAGKNHMNGLKGKGGGGASIPDDQLRIYQRLNPGASLAELQAFHAANNKS